MRYVAGWRWTSLFCYKHVLYASHVFNTPVSLAIIRKGPEMGHFGDNLEYIKTLKGARVASSGFGKVHIRLRECKKTSYLLHCDIYLKFQCDSWTNTNKM